jgi:hypothetical protein
LGVKFYPNQTKPKTIDDWIQENIWKRLYTGFRIYLLGVYTLT